MEETLEVITGPPTDLTHIVKGKRTKRQRLQSPIPFTIAIHSSSSNNGDYYNNNKITSPAISFDFPAGSTTEEEEDTAKCLILLSKGPSYQEFATYKINSKRYLPTPTTAGNGKPGIYVFECKTCGRTFPSFQALGGHRASHKKPKAAVVEEKTKFAFSDDDKEPLQVQPLRKIHYSSSSSSLSLQLNNRVSFGNTNYYKSSSKVHECSICGAEFNSGQALGGHMRRHRVPGGTTVTTTNTTLSLIPLSPIKAAEDDKKYRNDGLSLDLNLPAPDDDFAFVSKKQQQQKQQSAIVLPAAPTFVDCLY